MWCDVSTGVWRPVVPQGFRQQVFDTIHGLVHPEVHATTRLVSNRFVWPGLATDVKEWSRQCVACYRAKVTCMVTLVWRRTPYLGSASPACT